MKLPRILVRNSYISGGGEILVCIICCLVQSRESLPIKEADHVTIDIVSESTSVRDYVQHIIKSPDNTVS